MDRLDLSKVDWTQIMPRFGFEPLSPKRHSECPIERDTKKRFRFDNLNGKGSWICTNCGTGDGVRLIALIEGCDDAEAIRRIRGYSCSKRQIAVPLRKTPLAAEEPDRQWARKVLESVRAGSTALADSPALRYLQRRVPGLDPAWLSPDLMFNAGLSHVSYVNDDRLKQFFPAMVAIVRDAKGVPVTIHRTYLSEDGYKAPVEANQVKKLMTGTRKLNGDAIRINRPTGRTRTLILGEGIETACALVAATENRHAVWSLLNAANLGKCQIPLDDFDLVIIAADRDPASKTNGVRVGEHYASILQKRMIELGKRVRVRVPEKEGVDFCDLWFEKFHLQQANAG